MGEFEWPWEYNFPPFFTIQPHDKTREHQLKVWKDLILSYQKHRKEAILTVNTNSPLFCNDAIKRQLSPDARLQVMEELQKSGNAAPLGNKVQWEIYWYTLDEWADKIYTWVTNCGLNNTVCTLYELTSGDNSTSEEFYGLDEGVLRKALGKLQEKRKCELFDDESGGVKFF
ncbi:vacuolar protein-sorting-associated protein 25 [Lutzomyia longipalpis]|uniref:Vacuolar protein-sorting-associated protein 25 n=1 Tax=Lutzomyia longipalpis TaxID=7200 RepID=A0A1B0C8N6_LUTLO|nr:vacuolar protein-sorting-associated protein 25 [Lutzomyia longipalpis]